MDLYDNGDGFDIALADSARAYQLGIRPSSLTVYNPNTGTGKRVGLSG